MEVKIVPSGDNDHLLGGYNYNGGQIRILNSKLTEADTIEEMVRDKSKYFTDNCRFHFEVQEITFRDFASSGYNEPVPTVTESLADGEFLVRISILTPDYIKYDPIPIYASAESSDVGEYKIKSLKLDLTGILTHDQVYLPIEELFSSENNPITKVDNK